MQPRGWERRVIADDRAGGGACKIASRAVGAAARILAHAAPHTRPVVLEGFQEQRLLVAECGIEAGGVDADRRQELRSASDVVS